MKSIKVKEGDMVRFKHSENNHISLKFGGKIGLVLKVNHKSFLFGDPPALEITEVDVFLDGQIVKTTVGYLDKVENI